ncbi:Glucose regulated repressor protein [Heracleum sosnowskyi]|uniref:Glucose regulated repressor protein n=1 Tax=Heracleum sosnowskyi TaxID=360622 RepID=A0AAD8IH02_9APIA|nr:Glucose regulated repressor protein [Heracleum sosnowskyi]
MGSKVNGPVDQICINKSLTDDELISILSKLETQKDKEVFGLVCKRWLFLQSSQRKKLCVRAGPHMLQKMAARFTNLHHLDMSQSVNRSFYPGVTDSDLSVIASSFGCLRNLELRNLKGITDIGLAKIGSFLAHLQFLDVSYCRKITDKGLSAVAEGCPNLKSLHAGGCRYVTDALLKALSIHCHNLEELGLHGCTSITDSGLAFLVEGCQKIKYLDFRTYLISQLMNCILAQCRSLEVLDIGCCDEVTDAAFHGLGSEGSELILKILKVSNCSKITVVGLGMLLGSCKTLESLDVRSCPHIQKSGCDEAGLQFPTCCKVNFSGSLAEPAVLI